jgi:hypothetical protein
MSSDLTRLYSSLIQNLINASINNYIASTASKTNTSVNLTGATLAGLTNSAPAMIDDIITSYISTQLMVAKDTKLFLQLWLSKAFQRRERKCIIAILLLNFLFSWSRKRLLGPMDVKLSQISTILT